MGGPHPRWWALRMRKTERAETQQFTNSEQVQGDSLTLPHGCQQAPGGVDLLISGLLPFGSHSHGAGSSKRKWKEGSSSLGWTPAPAPTELHGILVLTDNIPHVQGFCCKTPAPSASPPAPQLKKRKTIGCFTSGKNKLPKLNFLVVSMITSNVWLLF